MIIDCDIENGLITRAKSEFKGELSINSNGGSLSEGLGFYDYLNSLDNSELVKVNIFGMCASAATFPILSFDRRVGSANSRYMIHNPWTFAVGDAKDIKKVADELTIEESAIVDIYEKHLSIDREAIVALMNENRIIKAEEALDINLITEITMADTKKIEEKLEEQGTILNRLVDFMKGLKKPELKNLVIQTQDGKELDFGEEITSEEEIIVGVTATVDGAPADGSFDRNGMTYVFEAGELKEINEAEPADENMDSLKKEIADLKAELEASKTSNDKVEEVLNSLKKEQASLKTLMNKISTDFSPEEIAHLKDQAEKKDVVRSAFKEK